MNVKIIGGKAYQYYDTGLSDEQYKNLKKRNPGKRFRKIRDDIYLNVDAEYMSSKRKKLVLL